MENNPFSSPKPGPSSAIDPLDVELSLLLSPVEFETYDIPDLNFEIGDDELYGILTESNDSILDEWTNEKYDEANIDAALQDADSRNEVENSQEDNSPDESSSWFPGNPDSMVELPFTGTSGILTPHQMAEKTPLDYFFLFLNGQIIDLIINCTNKNGNKLKSAAVATHSRFTRWADITLIEFRCFLGILLLMGTIKLNRMADYWSNHYLFCLSPRQFMSRDKFYLILRALSVQRNERNESLFKVKDLIDLFNDSINAIYYPVKELTIDESLILWKGRLAFRQYLKGKAHKYGVKLYILADANGIILKIHVYAGSKDQLVGGRNHVKKVIKLLMQKYLDKGHALYLDNFYTSVGIADELLDKNTYVTGTLRPNRVGNPALVKNTPLSLGESCIAHNNKKIVVTKWKDKREILFISTEHKSNYEGTTSRRVRTVKFKPAVQARYNKYMRAIDRHDQLLSYYCCEHKTLRWYKKVIIHIIQICLVNG
ncbi:piggyBac transposable element-derived protein 4-like [Melitaea cinxia]|uniref:piggyBac transposable element-derived protein 4-like n=1 Tax=Melitaea cinxia TaxID=113334 RepID=UPI001E272CF1|nr:piggyBac transposable element-derived protein 4-like [Melitaea cinxia]